ncbi:hypothetical protein [Sphingomonas lacusdianchii]|uniref:hypothetical protein n=1 Tax=Sphingomonas lacusdianchii TaxID=2917992 RepID=UPI001F57D8DF|nr:hypothetical protein [Sphingomonas sp. JXJ CY 53]
MGIPANYSRELPERCLHLIETLLPSVESISFPGQENIGPLTTTFLLALATPMIVLPIERVERHRGKHFEGYVDERPLDPQLTALIDGELGGRALRHSSFFAPAEWRLARFPHQPGQNLARYFPHELSAELNTPQAEARASAMAASEWASCLRNALAHGGVAYLDADGFQKYGMKADKLAFISGKYVADAQMPESLKVLCIKEQDFLAFIRRWVSWLTATGLSLDLAA